MTPENRTKLQTLIMNEEGLRLSPYRDSLGNLTEGYGHRTTNPAPITNAEALALLNDDILYFVNKLRVDLPWYLDLDEIRQMAIISMAFNLGLKGLLGFHHMLAALEKHDWQAAHDYCLDSLAAKQASNRYKEIANILLTGEL